MSPLQVTLLLHIYAICEPIPGVLNAAQQEILKEMIRLGLIKEDITASSGYVITLRGRALVQNILATKVPDIVQVAKLQDGSYKEIN